MVSLLVKLLIIRIRGSLLILIVNHKHKERVSTLFVIRRMIKVVVTKLETVIKFVSLLSYRLRELWTILK